MADPEEFSSRAKELDALIRADYLPSLGVLDQLWAEMGLSGREVEERFERVSSEVLKVTAKMVECDTRHRNKIRQRCQEQRAEAAALREELGLSGTEVPRNLALVDQNKRLKAELTRLEEEKEKIMVKFRSLLSEERHLAAKLDRRCVKVDKKRIPDAAAKQAVEDNIAEMKRLAEEREDKMFEMKEDITRLCDVLDMDMNATSIALLLPEGHQEGSLRPADLEAVAATLQDLQGRMAARRDEVGAMVEQVRGLYDKLAVVQEERIDLCADLEELCRTDAMENVAEELARLRRAKLELMGDIVASAREDLEVLWEERLVGRAARQAFLAAELPDPDAELERLEEKTRHTQEELLRHGDVIEKLRRFLERCQLARKLQLRLQDPARLFKARGDDLMREEQDRKLVNALPAVKEELVELVERWGDFAVMDATVSAVVERETRLLEQIFENHLSTSTASRPARAKRGNVTASPRSKKRAGRLVTSPAGVRRPLTRSNSTLGAGSSAAAVKTSSSLSCKPSGARSRARAVDESPVARPSSALGTRPAPKARLDAPRLVVQEASLSESVFGERVSLSSTMMADRQGEEVDRVLADYTRLEASMARLRDAQQVTLPRPDKASSRRNHRRSNSCTELINRQKKARTKEEGAARTKEGASRNGAGAASVTMAGTGQPAGRRAGGGPASNPRLVRTASSTRLFVR